MIIDCHVHLNRYESEEPARLEDRYHRLKDEMAQNDVDLAFVLSSYRVTDDRPDVTRLLEVIGGDTALRVVAGVSYNHYRAHDLADLRALLREGRIIGLKLYPGYEAFYVHDPRMRVIYELAAEFGVPVMIHTGDTFDPEGKVRYAHPLEVDEVAVEFRDVNFVICHLGNPWITDAMEVIYKNENVVADISGFTVKHFQERFERYMLAQLGEAIAFAGDPHSILFGTDWPICDMGAYHRFARKLDLTDEERHDVMFRNAARVFRLEVGAATPASAD